MEPGQVMGQGYGQRRLPGDSNAGLSHLPGRVEERVRSHHIQGDGEPELQKHKAPHPVSGHKEGCLVEIRPRICSNNKFQHSDTNLTKREGKRHRYVASYTHHPYFPHFLLPQSPTGNFSESLAFSRAKAGTLCP